VPVFDVQAALESQLNTLTTHRLKQTGMRNARHFDEQVVKLDHWAEDLKSGLERDLKDLDLQIRAARKESTQSPNLEGKLAAQKQLRALDQIRTRKRRELFESQDGIDGRRDNLIAQIEAQMKQTQRTDALFTLRWVLQP